VIEEVQNRRHYSVCCDSSILRIGTSSYLQYTLVRDLEEYTSTLFEYD
jgi:hypothetical protein